MSTWKAVVIKRRRITDRYSRKNESCKINKSNSTGDMKPGR